MWGLAFNLAVKQLCNVIAVILTSTNHQIEFPNILILKVPRRGTLAAMILALFLALGFCMAEVSAVYYIDNLNASVTYKGPNWHQYSNSLAFDGAMRMHRLHIIIQNM
jgi:hypothetical protein